MLPDLLDKDTWDRIRKWAADTASDGCTGVADFRVDCCFLHDYMYVTGTDFSGNPVTKKQADECFRKCIQARSPLGRLSPMSWIRWAGVSLFGRGIWAKNQKSV
jgi:hypothetical protein